MNINDLISQFARYLKRINDIDIIQLCGLTYGNTTTNLKTQYPVVINLYNEQITVEVAYDIPVTACAVQAVSTFCYYLVSAGRDGTITTTKGIDNTYGLPTLPKDNIAIGAFLINTDAATTFTAGTTAFDAAGITVEFYDIDCGIASQLINQAMKKLERGVTIMRDGRPRTLADFEYMKVRALVALNQGDSTVTLPFTGYKDFVEVTLTDPVGVISQLKKEDMLPLGISDLQSRPVRISRVPTVETTFTPDGAPAMIFQVWPICDQAYTLDVTAYQYSPSLDGVLYSENWLTNNAPDVLIFGALLEAVSYMTPIDIRTPEWKDRYYEAVWTLYTSQAKERYAGSHVYTKFPDPLRQRVSADGMASSYIGIYSYGFVEDTP